MKLSEKLRSSQKWFLDQIEKLPPTLMERFTLSESAHRNWLGRMHRWIEERASEADMLERARDEARAGLADLHRRIVGREPCRDVVGCIKSKLAEQPGAAKGE